jgi:hypothetical protein
MKGNMPDAFRFLNRRRHGVGRGASVSTEGGFIFFEKNSLGHHCLHEMTGSSGPAASPKAPAGAPSNNPPRSSFLRIALIVGISVVALVVLTSWNSNRPSPLLFVEMNTITPAVGAPVERASPLVPGTKFRSISRKPPQRLPTPPPSGPKATAAPTPPPPQEIQLAILILSDKRASSATLRLAARRTFLFPFFHPVHSSSVTLLQFAPLY